MTKTLTHPEWNKETGGLEVAKAFSNQIKGKTILITGVSPESIGSSTALALASQSPSLLIFASRTQSKLDDAAKSVKDVYPSTAIQTVLMDLGSQESVRNAAAEITKLTNHLDIIINNAAVMTLKHQYTMEGIETQFGSNHIGHFLLTNLLLPQMFSAAKSQPGGSTRVINLTSLGHRVSPIRFHDYNLEGKEIPPEEEPVQLPTGMAKATEGTYNGYVAYGQAKTANVLYSVELNRLFKGKGIVSYALHPGSIWTGLSRNLDAENEEIIRNVAPFWKNHDQGCATTLVSALDPALNEPEGVLLHDCQLFDAPPHATDPKLAERLWDLSEKLVKTDFKF